MSPAPLPPPSHPPASRLRRVARLLSTPSLILAVWLGVSAWQTRHIPAQAPSPHPVATPVIQGAPGAPQRTLTWEQALAEVRARAPGQPVAVYVWAEWCPICRASESTVTALAETHPVLTVAMQSGPPEAVARVQRQRSLPWTTAVDPDATLARQLGVQAVPAFMVLQPDGRLRLPSVGYTSGWGMRARLWLARWM